MIRIWQKTLPRTHFFNYGKCGHNLTRTVISKDTYIPFPWNLLFREIRRLNILRNYTDRIKEEIKEAEEPQIEENLSRDMIEQQILALLAELPEARRRIFLMRWSNGLSNKEIAQKLSISEKTVSTQIHRTIHFLKSKIGPIFMVFLIITSTKF